MKYARLAFAYFLVHLASKFINIKNGRSKSVKNMSGVRFSNVVIIVALIVLAASSFFILSCIKYINSSKYNIMSMIGADSLKFAISVFEVSIFGLVLLSIISLGSMLIDIDMSSNTGGVDKDQDREEVEVDRKWIIGLARLSGILATFIFKLATFIFVTLFISTYVPTLIDLSSEKNEIIESITDSNLRDRIKKVEVVCETPSSSNYRAVVDANLDLGEYGKVFDRLDKYEIKFCRYHEQMYGMVAIYILGVFLYVLYYICCKYRKGDWI